MAFYKVICIDEEQGITNEKTYLDSTSAFLHAQQAIINSITFKEFYNSVEMLKLKNRDSLDGETLLKVDVSECCWLSE